jgi:hypothetical protein
MMVARCTREPAYANLRGRKPREVGRGGASDVMGNSSLAAAIAIYPCVLGKQTRPHSDLDLAVNLHELPPGSCSPSNFVGE